jgi:predicted ATPase
VITEFKVSRWRILRDVELQLSPLHALIGPNDSGKSTLLDALYRACNLGTPDEPKASFEVRTRQISVRSLWRQSFSGEHVIRARTELGITRRLQLEPGRMRQPSHLMPRDNVALGEHGEHLPGVYDAILGRDREAWDTIEKSVRAAFPNVRRLTLRAIDDAHKVLDIELADGTVIPAERASEGLLFWLAFSSLPYMSPTKLLLLERPENGLHPTRIPELLSILRRVVARGTQVVFTTYSPLVVGELSPEEISVVTRTAEAGTQVHRVSELPGLERHGLWLPLVEGQPEETVPFKKGA